MYITKGVTVWLVISSIIVIIDAFYVLNRPHTLQGGKYGQYYALYQHYVKYDSLYVDTKDIFLPIVAYLNLAEVIITVLGLIFTLMSSKTAKFAGAILAILASAFVFWKTVIYIWYDVDFMSEATKTFAPDALLLYYLPNSFWIFCPIWSIFSIAGKIGGDIFSRL